MKKVAFLTLGIVVIVLASYVLINLRSVYFVDARTQEKTKLTSFWFKRDEITMKDRWFSDFDDDVISGFVLIEDQKTYAIIPYVFTKPIFDQELDIFYQANLDRNKEIIWRDKENDQAVIYDISEEIAIEVAVDVYPGYVTEPLKYGDGIYTVPVYNDLGDIVEHVQFLESSQTGLREGFNNSIPCYILQTVLFVEININNHETMNLLIPTFFVGGLLSAEINDDHYYDQYFDQLLVFEATLDKPND